MLNSLDLPSLSVHVFSVRNLYEFPFSSLLKVGVTINNTYHPRQL